MQYVCTELYLDVATGRHICMSWEQHAPLFPDLTASEWSGIAIAMITVLATAWVFKTLSTFVKES